MSFIEGKLPSILTKLCFHRRFNSWDRQPIVHNGDGDTAGTVQINPRTHQIHQNFIMNRFVEIVCFLQFLLNESLRVIRNWLGSTRSGYSIDYDDGTSQYNATSNFLVYAGFKVRDGVNRCANLSIVFWFGFASLCVFISWC